ncbi:MAG: S9 family peptidase [Planctomycetes bacterium]|nr:S9 family peptidase [Planctomycetota bacterium]
MFHLRIHPVLVASLFLVSSCSSEPDAAPRSTPIERAALAYPVARRADVVDDYHGVRVTDPYRWLEDPDAPETRAWVDAQNALARAWIDAVPEREAIEARLTQLWNYERYGVPSREGGLVIFAKNDGLQNQPVYWVAAGVDAPPRVLLDPNTLSKDGTASVGSTRASPDGALFAYEVSEGGSDWPTVRVRDVSTGQDRADRVEWVKFSGLAWSPDSAGFYYSTFPDHDTTGNVKLVKQELRYHRLGTPQSADVLVHARADQPEWGFSGYVTDDGTTLVITVTKGTDPRTQVLLKNLARPDDAVVELVTGFDAEYEFIEKSGDELFFKTDLDAPTKRVIAIQRAAPERARWREVLPADPGRTLQSAVLCGGRLVTAYLEDAHSVVFVDALVGRQRAQVALPALGSVAGLSGGPRDGDVYVSFSSFARAAEVLRLDVATRALSVWRSPKTAFDPADYVTEQVFATSRDGTRVPLFVTRKKSVAPSASTPCLLYGYGGFDVSITPAFNAGVIAWMDQGALYASAVLRGGGEYGRDWHAAGTQERKQNVFDDFIACAELLIARGWTSAPKLAIQGHSNGGLLVGACLTQRPDLFGGALPGVGVLDMLRYDQFTIGWAWESDYGSARRSRAAFDWLRAYSPLHNVRAGACYPATLVTTADHDDRVVPAHSYKFTAALQAAQACAQPILIRVDVKAGHGAGKPTSMKIDELADQWAFLWRALGMSRAAAR